MNINDGEKSKKEQIAHIMHEKKKTDKEIIVINAKKTHMARLDDAIEVMSEYEGQINF